MIVGIVKEKAGESRVSLLPEQADALLKRKVNILIEKGAGEQAYASDGAYEAKNIKAPVYLSANLPGGDQRNRQLEGALRNRIRRL